MLKLENLKVQSFVTISDSAKANIRGGEKQKDTGFFGCTGYNGCEPHGN